MRGKCGRTEDQCVLCHVAICPKIIQEMQHCTKSLGFNPTSFQFHSKIVSNIYTLISVHTQTFSPDSTNDFISIAVSY